MLNKLQRILSSKKQRAILQNIGWLFFDKALRLLGGLLVGVWVARYLGPAKFGMLNYAIALASIFSALSTLGLDGLIVRDVVRKPAARGEILGTALVLRLGAGMITIMLIQVMAWIARPDDTVVRVVVAFVSFATVGGAVDVLTPWFESQVRSKYKVIAENVAFVFAALVRVVLILTKKPLILFAATMAAEVFLAKIFLWTFYARTGERFRNFSIRLERAKSLLEEGWPLILSGLSVLIYMRIDQIMLASMVGDEAVGIYSAAVRISKIWYFVPVTIVASVSPSLTAVQYHDYQRYQQGFQQLFSLLTILSYIVIAPLTCSAPLLVKWLYGDIYADAGMVLSIHVWAGLFVAMEVASSRWLINDGFAKMIMYRAIISAVVNIVLNYVLIPIYGPVGAAWATVVSYSVSGFILHAFVRRTRKLFTQQVRSLVFAGIVQLSKSR